MLDPLRLVIRFVFYLQLNKELRELFKYDINSKEIRGSAIRKAFETKLFFPSPHKNKMAKWFEDEAFANKVCELVFDNYKRLGKKGKPVAGKEWTMLAAVVAVFEQKLGKGIKCVTVSGQFGEFCIQLEWR